ncbi:MAG: metalloregulator ArsR/SmtB family transcription factor [Clostridiales bacterium]|nr:metalloregulator ArsR/SmtB family transcription factor [Clostridiales bacterium]
MGVKRFAFTRKIEDDGSYSSKDEAHAGIVFCTGISPLSTEKSEKEMETYVNEILKALSDRSKFEILSYIKDKRAYGSELAKHMGLTTATISHHMSALFTCGLVELSKEYNRIFYRENKKAVEEVLDYCRKVLLEE